MYPVDLPAERDADLTSASEEYLSSLQSRPRQNQWFPLSHSTKVTQRLRVTFIISAVLTCYIVSNKVAA